MLLVRCASGEGGMRGRLSQAAGDGSVAVSSAAYGLRMWHNDRATGNQRTVLFGDMKDQIVQAYTSFSELDIDDAADARASEHLLQLLTQRKYKSIARTYRARRNFPQ